MGSRNRRQCVDERRDEGGDGETTASVCGQYFKHARPQLRPGGSRERGESDQLQRRGALSLIFGRQQAERFDETLVECLVLKLAYMASLGPREREREKRGGMQKTPGFRTRGSKFWVGTAPTGRAKCRSCKKSIEKGGVRLVALAFVCPGRSCKLVHHACCVTPKLAKAVLEVCGDVSRVPMSEDVTEQEQRAMRVRLLNLIK